MEKENRLFTVILVGLAAVAAGLGVVFTVGIALQTSTVPINAALQQVIAGQRAIEGKLSANNSAVLEARIAALEAEIRTLKMMGGRPGPQGPRQPQQEPQAEDMDKVYDLPAGSSYVLGPKDAPVKIVTFMDYQCPFCGRFYPAALEAQKAFPTKVSLVIKHFPLPFHPMARPAAKAAMAAGEQGKFFEMTSMILENSGTLSNDKFKELAGKLGLNTARFEKDLKDNDAAYEKALQVDGDLTQKSDVRGTPSFFLNGKKSNARGADQWKQEIQALLKK